MFLLRSMTEHEDDWKQAGIRNKLALFALLDEFIQRDEAFRKLKTRNYAIDKRQELDRKLIEARTKRIEKEKHENAINQSLRILELEKRKRENIEAANRRFQKMMADAKERDAFHKKRLQAIKRESHKKQDREKSTLYEKGHFTESKNVRHLNKLQEVKSREKIDLLRQRIFEIEHKKAKAREDTRQKIQNIDQIQRQKTEYHLKRLRDLERNHEKETFSLVSRINNLEMKKERQKNTLKKLNEQFKKELENRDKMASLQIQNVEKRKQKYFSKLNSRITKLGKEKDNLLYNSRENLSVLRENFGKGITFISPTGYSFENKKTNVNEREWSGVNEGSKHEERERIDTYQNTKQKNSLHHIEEATPESDVTGEESSTPDQRTTEDMQKEQKKIWDLEAKTREKQRIRDEFRKLMSSFRK